MNKATNCKNCGYVKNINGVHNNFYCDNEERTDDMGFLGKDNLSESVPEWCPMDNKSKLEYVIVDEGRKIYGDYGYVWNTKFGRIVTVNSSLDLKSKISIRDAHTGKNIAEIDMKNVLMELLNMHRE